MATKRILVFNVNWLGDVLFSTALIRNLRYHFPDSFIACVIPGRCREILEGNHRLDEIIIFDEKAEQKSLIGILRFIGLLRKKKFDMVFLLHRSFTRALICWLAGIPERIGYYTRKRGFLLTKKLNAPAFDSLHRIDYYLEVLTQAGIAVKDRFSELFIGKDDAAAVDGFFKRNDIRAGDFLVGINPGGNWYPKRWEKDYFSVLSDRLICELDAKVIISGSESDKKLAQEIQRTMQKKAVIACGEFTLKQFAALSRRLDIFVTADSGPLHIANAAGAKKIIALFGPTDPAITGPYPADNAVVLRKAVGCKIPCYVPGCQDNRCMKAITPEEVLGKIKELRYSS